MIYNEKPNNFIPGLEVVGCLVESHGKILLLHRNDDKTQGGTWGIPAGKMEDKDNNDIAVATLRELEEETGLVVNKDDLIYHKTFFVSYPDKNYLYHYHKINLEKEVLDIIIEEHEHQDFAWVTPEEALSMPLIRHEDHCIKHIYEIN